MKLNTPMKHEHFALIIFTNSFPVDMLRYDACMPHSEVDSGRIASSFDPFYKNSETTFAVVRKFSPDTKPYWTPARWQSYGGVYFIPIDQQEVYDIRNAQEEYCRNHGTSLTFLPENILLRHVNGNRLIKLATKEVA